MATRTLKPGCSSRSRQTCAAAPASRAPALPARRPSWGAAGPPCRAALPCPRLHVPHHLAAAQWQAARPASAPAPYPCRDQGLEAEPGYPCRAAGPAAPVATQRMTTLRPGCSGRSTASSSSCSKQRNRSGASGRGEALSRPPLRGTAAVLPGRRPGNAHWRLRLLSGRMLRRPQGHTASSRCGGSAWMPPAAAAQARPPRRLAAAHGPQAAAAAAAARYVHWQRALHLHLSPAGARVRVCV